jgi:molybdopterin-guanine dinucleotide biosynthesis protein A
MNICAVIVAGGRSTRMGREKALETVRGRRIIDRVIAAVSAQVDMVAINANGDISRFADTGLAVFPDDAPDVGTPLAGLHAALGFAVRQGMKAVLTVPSDTPFLPGDLVARLDAAGARAAIAASGGQDHYLTGLWSSSLLGEIRKALAQPHLPRMQDWAKACGAAVVEWPAAPHDPFFNVNTPNELAEAERIAASFGQ